LYLTHLAFGFPTGGNALFRHVCCKSTAMRNNGKCTKCELSPCQKKHGILEVPEETDCSGITSVRISFLSISQSQDREEEIDKKRELE
ncbi:hypothetical protein T09_1695, partial [Trichinella sp. T9]